MSAILPALDLAQCVTLACTWEAAVPKTGNVHRSADFEDTSFYEFLTSGILMAPRLTAATTVGQRVLGAVSTSRAVTRGNTHLGTILLLAPLCAVPLTQALDVGLPTVLQSLTAQDTRDVYAAIRLARAGGLGDVSAGDVSAEPISDLITAMGWAAERDRIARQYVTDYGDVLFDVAPRLCRNIQRYRFVRGVLVTQWELMYQWPDSLIARKCGDQVARESAARAERVLNALQGPEGDWEAAAADFDFWLRSDGHRRNPGTTADLIAAGLFAALREQQLTTFEWDTCT